MTDEQVRTVEMLKHVKAFGNKAEIAFEPESLGGKLFAQVAEALDALAEGASKQITGSENSKAATQVRTLAREILMRQLRAISETAGSIEYDIPGTAAKFAVSRALPG